MSGFYICDLSCGCKTRTLTPYTEPFSGTFKIKCIKHQNYNLPEDFLKMYLPKDTIWAECPIDFGGEYYEPEY